MSEREGSADDFRRLFGLEPPDAAGADDEPDPDAREEEPFDPFRFPSPAEKRAADQRFLEMLHPKQEPDA